MERLIGHGGRRSGAGRPPIDTLTMQRVTVTLPDWAVTWARGEGRGNLSAGLRRLLEELDQRQGVTPVMLAEGQSA
jgi:hypothetical protein